MYVFASALATVYLTVKWWKERHERRRHRQMVDELALYEHGHLR